MGTTTFHLRVGACGGYCGIRLREMPLTWDKLRDAALAA